MPTFGKTDSGASSSASSTDKLAMSTATPASTGVVQNGSVRLWLSTSGSTSVKFVIYADSSGSPGALLAQSDVVTLTTTTADTQIDFPFSGGQQITVVSGTPYWFGPFWQDPGTPSVTFGRDSAASGRLEFTTPWPDPPDPAGTGTVLSGPLAAFVTYLLPTGKTSRIYGQARRRASLF